MDERPAERIAGPCPFHLVSSSTSSDLVLRCYAPPMIAEAHRHASARLGSSLQRLTRRMTFVDVSVRFLFAVLASEWNGLGLRDPPPGYTELVGKLDRPSWGHWLQAAASLSSVLVRKLDEMVVPEAALVMRSKKGRETELSRGLRTFVQVRNDMAHGEGGFPLPGEQEAEQWLEELDSPLRAFQQGLRFLRHNPLLVAGIPATNRRSRRRVVPVHRFSGQAVERFDEVGLVQPDALMEHLPFLVSSRGDLLSLEPWIRARQDIGDRFESPRLLARWDQGVAVYSDAHRRDGCSIDMTGDWPDGRSSLLERSAEELRSPGVFSPAGAALLRDGGPEAPPDLPGVTLLRTIGKGGSSVVYLGRTEGRKEEVAVKVLRSRASQDGIQVKRLRNEFEAMRSLVHPRIATVYAYAEEPVPHLVMEWIDGTDLGKLARDNPMGPHQAALVADQILQALERAHAASPRPVIHRDIKPSNVIVCSGDGPLGVKVIDFGVATAVLEHGGRPTLTTDGLGSLDFAAPEQWEARGAEPRADLYSVGKLLEFCVRGGLGGRVQGGRKVPPGVKAVLRKATRQRPGDRFQSAKEMRAYLASRREQGWEGVPVALGDVTEHGYRFEQLLGTVTPGTWVFLGSSSTTQRRCGLIVCDGEGAAEVLTERLRLADPVTSMECGHPTPIRGSDGLLVVVLPADDALARAARLLGHAAVDTQGPDRGGSRSNPGVDREPREGGQRRAEVGDQHTKAPRQVEQAMPTPRAELTVETNERLPSDDTRALVQTLSQVSMDSARLSLLAVYVQGVAAPARLRWDEILALFTMDSNKKEALGILVTWAGETAGIDVGCTLRILHLISMDSTTLSVVKELVKISAFEHLEQGTLVEALDTVTLDTRKLSMLQVLLARTKPLPQPQHHRIVAQFSMDSMKLAAARALARHSSA